MLSMLLIIHIIRVIIIIITNEKICDAVAKMLQGHFTRLYTLQVAVLIILYFALVL